MKKADHTPFSSGILTSLEVSGTHVCWTAAGLAEVVYRMTGVKPVTICSIAKDANHQAELSFVRKTLTFVYFLFYAIPRMFCVLPFRTFLSPKQ